MISQLFRNADQDDSAGKKRNRLCLIFSENIFRPADMFCLVSHFLRRGAISADSFQLQRRISFS